jgi:hypothetical protein
MHPPLPMATVTSATAFTMYPAVATVTAAAPLEWRGKPSENTEWPMHDLVEDREDEIMSLPCVSFPR